MAKSGIKSGEEVVADFLETIGANADVDAATLACIQTLRGEGKLSKTALLKSLQTTRAGGNTSDED